MYIAVTKTGQRVRPTKELRKALCQCCNAVVIAKTGMVKNWHWAHIANSCPYSKGKGEWHYKWQNMLDVSEVEVRDPSWPNNIADICIRDSRLPDGYLVVELQQSPISFEDVESRTLAYNNILWIVNTTGKSSLPAWADSDITKNRVMRCTEVGEFNELYFSGNHYKVGFESSANMKKFLIQLYFKSIIMRKNEMYQHMNRMEWLQQDIDAKQSVLDKHRSELLSMRANHSKWFGSVANVVINDCDDSILAEHQLIYCNGVKIKLNVQYNEKDIVKELGARWDSRGTYWYIPRDFDEPINGFAKWIDSIIE